MNAIIDKEAEMTDEFEEILSDICDNWRDNYNKNFIVPRLMLLKKIIEGKSDDR